MREKSRARAEKFAYRPPGAPAPAPKLTPRRSSVKLGEKEDGKLPSPQPTPRPNSTPRKALKSSRSKESKTFLSLTPRQNPMEVLPTPSPGVRTTAPRADADHHPSPAPSLGMPPSLADAPTLEEVVSERQHARRRRPATDSTIKPVTDMTDSTLPTPNRTPPPSMEVLTARGHVGLSAEERLALEGQRHAAVLMQRVQRGNSARALVRSCGLAEAQLAQVHALTREAQLAELTRVVENLERAVSDKMRSAGALQPSAATGRGAHLPVEVVSSERSAPRGALSDAERRELHELRARVPALALAAASALASSEEASSLKAQMGALRTEVEQLRAAAAAAQAATASEAAGVSAASARLPGAPSPAAPLAWSELEALRRENAELLAEMAGIEPLRRENAELLAEMAEIESRLGESERLEMELEGARRELQAVRSLSAVSQRELTQALAQISILEMEIASLKAGRAGRWAAAGGGGSEGGGEGEGGGGEGGGGEGGGGEGGELRKGVRLSRTSSSLRTRPRDVQRERELFYACGYDVATKQYATPNLEAVRAAFQGGFVGVNCRDNTGTSPLAHAAWVGHEELIALLIERGADLDAENLDGATPLHYTVYNNQPRAAALLLTCGAEPATALEDTAAVAKPEVLAVLRAAQAGKVHPLLVAARRKAQDWNLTRTPR